MVRSIFQKISHHWVSLLVLMAVWGSYFVYLFSKIIVQKPDGLYAGHQNVWGDWPLHIGIINLFANKPFSYWFDYHPIYAGGKFTYPFLTNLISALLVKMGLPLTLSMIIPSIIMIIIFIIGIYFLFYLLTKSRIQSVLAIFLFFLSAGFGFIFFITENIDTLNIGTWLYPPRDYSAFNQYGWWSGNVVQGLLVPQRGFLIGITMGVWSLLLLLSVLAEKISVHWRKRSLILAGILTGILPIAHMHSFIVVMVVSGFVFLTQRKKWFEFIWFATPAVLISAVLYFSFIHGGIESDNFFAVDVWWSANGPGDWLKLMGLFWGLSLPLAVIAWITCFKKLSPMSNAFIAGLIAFFILGNIVLFQPVAWDNTKIYWWSYLAIALLCARFLIELFTQKSLVFISSAVIVAIILSLTGFLELVRLVQVDKHSFRMIDTKAMKMGEFVRENTGLNDRFLTAPSHNHPIMMWGARPIFLGYWVWAWNFGFDYQSRQRELRLMYAGGPSAEKLFKKHDIKYVVIGAQEIFEEKANENYFAANFAKLFDGQDFRIYDLSRRL